MNEMVNGANVEFPVVGKDEYAEVLFVLDAEPSNGGDTVRELLRDLTHRALVGEPTQQAALQIAKTVKDVVGTDIQSMDELLDDLVAAL